PGRRDDGATSQPGFVDELSVTTEDLCPEWGAEEPTDDCDLFPLACGMFSWSGTASIRRPPVFQTGALPTELPDLPNQTLGPRIRLAGATGFEPATSGLTGRRTLQAVLRPRGRRRFTVGSRGDQRSIDLDIVCSTWTGMRRRPHECWS